jgi:hypothetical protein
MGSVMDTAYVDRTHERAALPPVAPQPAAALDYASPGMRLREPFDWPGAIRQFFFALGVGLLTFAIFSVWGDRPWSDDGCGWAGVGAGLIALTMPWPGRFGRRRGER